MGTAHKIRIVDGLVCRITGKTEGVHGGKEKYRDWWFGKKEFNVTIGTLPKEYWGKHIRIRIEVEVDGEWQKIIPAQIVEE